MERHFGICPDCGLDVSNRQENHKRYGECEKEQTLAKLAREWNNNQCEGCFSPLRDCVCEMPTIEEVLEETQKTAPEGWTVSHEYPNQIGVSHPTLTDDEFIMFGDVNGFFSFNDCLDVCGDMEGITNAEEIASVFWQQIATFYPNLIKGE